MTELREDHINSAVAFLREPQVSSAALAKKTEFLESKGLTSEEIGEALRRSQEETNAAVTAPTPGVVRNTSMISGGPVPPRPSYMMQTPPPIPERDWKDYFVMATVSVGVAYGLYECARRYVLPMIMPPTPGALEADKAALEAEFERTEQLLKQVQEDTSEMKKLEEARTAEFEAVMKEAREVISTLKRENDERKQESKLALSNVETLRDLLPRSLKEYSETQAQAVMELQNELKSLKSLLSRRQASAPQIPPASAVPSSLPGFPRKPKAPKPEEPVKPAVSEQVSKEATPEVANGSKEEAKPEGKSPEQKNDFIPDPQAGIPEWQRAAAGQQ